MTSVELAQRLVGFLDEKDLSLVTMNVRAAIVDAMNAGTQRFYANAPDYLTRVKASGHFKAPKQITIDVNEGSMNFTGYKFLKEDAYCSVQIEGDTGYNQINGPGELMDIYLGTTGTKRATIYSDVIPVHEPIKRLITDPYMIDLKKPINKIDSNDSAEYIQHQKTTGTPNFYSVEHNARADQGIALFILRTDTLPDTNYRYRMEVEMAPYRVSVLSLLDNVDLPFRLDHIESYIMPLVKANLSSSPLWKDQETKRDAKGEGLEALALMKRELVSAPTRQTNRVGTPKGW